MDGKVVDSKVAYSKDVGSRKASGEKVSGFLADFCEAVLPRCTVGSR